jgi:acetyl esterase/lipase
MVMATAFALAFSGLVLYWPAQFAAAPTTLALAPAWAQEADDEDQPMGGLGRGAGLNRKELPAGVSTKIDLPYGNDLKQKVDVYIPEKASAAPIILMVHGGAWQIGDKNSRGVVLNKVAHWCPRGFIFVSVGYRLVPQAGPIDQANDVALALAFVQAQAKSWGGEPGSCILMGHSSGAHLVSLLTADPTIATKAGAAPWLGTVSLDSAAMDVTARMTAPHLRFMDRAFGNDRAYWKNASPFDRLSGVTRPILLVYSSLRKDSTAQAKAFAERITSLGGQASLLPEALRHGQINSELGLPGAYTDKVDAFIDGLVGR